jgi:ABC-type cobalamin/Fe3+-siderophores transport system ATPase subunit
MNNEIIIVHGPQGCGKTKNIKTLINIFKPDLVCDGNGLHHSELETDLYKLRNGKVKALWLTHVLPTGHDVSRLTKSKSYSITRHRFDTVMIDNEKS